MSDNARDYSSVQLTPREQAYLLHLTQQDNVIDGLRIFCRYVGAYNSDTPKPRHQPLSLAGEPAQETSSNAQLNF